MGLLQLGGQPAAVAYVWPKAPACKFCSPVKNYQARAFIKKKTDTLGYITI